MYTWGARPIRKATSTVVLCNAVNLRFTDVDFLSQHSKYINTNMTTESRIIEVKLS